MFKRLWFHYIPYGAIDLLLAIAIISEIINKRFDLLWANVPILLIGLWSFGRKSWDIENDSTD